MLKSTPPYVLSTPPRYLLDTVVYKYLTQSVLASFLINWQDVFTGSPEPKTQVSFSDQNLSVVCRCQKKKLKIFFSRTTKPISTKLGTKFPWVKGIQVCSNEGPRPFPRGDNYEIAKIHWRNYNFFLLQNHWPMGLLFSSLVYFFINFLL